MSWQDDLRRLDEELSAGRIAADDYRLRREQLLAAAAGGGPAPQQQQNQQSPVENTQIMRPVAGPPNTQQGGAPQDPAAGTTQVVPGRGQQGQGNQGAQPGDADRTQVVPGERTQMVAGPYQQPGYPQQHSPAGGFPQPNAQNQSWDASPPWGGGDFPPLAATPNWIKQGPEVFDESSSNTGKRVLMIVGIVVVVLLIGGGIVLFGFRGSANSNTAGPAAAATTTEPPTTTTTKKLIDQLPTPPGTPNASNGMLTLTGAQSANVVTADQLQALQTAGVQNVAFKASTKDAFTYTAFVFTASGTDAAAQLATALSGLEKNTGMVPGAHGSLPQNATVLQFVRPGDTAHYNVVYASGTKVVFVDVLQKPASADDKAVLGEFEPYAVAVAQAFPGS